MRRMFLSGSLLAAAMTLAVPAFAQDTKTARGTVTAMSADSITIKAGTQDVKVMVDPKTEVIAEGGSTASRAAAAKGTAGPKLAELVKVGDNVEVSYRETGGMMHATTVRRVRSVGTGGVSEAKPAALSSNGTVTTVSGTSLTISGSSGGGGTFTQTFTVDNTTKVVAEGAGTASQKGKVTITDLVSKGSRVTVTYREAANNVLHATEVRVHGGKP